MTSPLKNSSEGFPHPWWKRSGKIWRGCWKQVLSTLVKVNCVTQSCWFTRKTEVFTFALTFVSSISEPRKTLICFPRYRKPLKAWLEQVVVANSHGWSIKAVHHLHHGKPRIFECKHVSFGLCNAPAPFCRLMQNCLGELNLTYCLIYLDDVKGFLKMEEEDLELLHVVFNCFEEHTLRLKPTKCMFFKDEINYMAHHVSKEGVWPSKENPKAVAEFTLPQTHIEIQAFLGSVGYYRQFIKAFASIAQPLHEHLLGKVPIRRASEWNSQRRPVIHLRLLTRLVLKLLCWLLLTLTSHFS